MIACGGPATGASAGTVHADGRARIIHGRFCCNRSSSGERRGLPEGGSLFSDLDAIDEVGGLSEAIRGEVAILSVVQDQSFSHGLREL